MKVLKKKINLNAKSVFKFQKSMPKAGSPETTDPTTSTSTTVSTLMGF
jgi:hypothetical protein